MGRSPFWDVLNKYAPKPLPGNENVKGAKFVRSCCWRPSWLRLILLTTQSPNTGIRLSCVRSKLASDVWARKLNFQLLLIACAKLSANDGEGWVFFCGTKAVGVIVKEWLCSGSWTDQRFFDWVCLLEKRFKTSQLYTGVIFLASSVYIKYINPLSSRSFLWYWWRWDEKGGGNVRMRYKDFTLHCTHKGKQTPFNSCS